MSHNHHSHGHSHGLSTPGQRHRSRLALVLVLVLVYMVAEVIGGLLTGSLALLADAGHMFSDAAALGLSLFAIWISQRPPTPQKSYGYYRMEILAALLNGATLVAVSIYIFIEAYQRFLDPPEVLAPLMIWVATGGLMVNLAGLVILHRGRSESLNLRGAWLHVLGDALGSVGAILAGLLIWRFGWHWADPLASVLIGALILVSSWTLLRDSVNVLLEIAPRHIDVNEVSRVMSEVRGVLGVEDLHIWTVTSGLESLSAHVIVSEDRDGRSLLHELRELLHDRFGIDHITIQLEPEDFPERDVLI